jgi:hypothetical protein
VLEKYEVVREGWRKLHYKELHDLYALSYKIRVVKSRKTEWSRIVARLGKMTSEFKIVFGNPE